jgi:hypothetical protein
LEKRFIDISYGVGKKSRPIHRAPPTGSKRGSDRLKHAQFPEIGHNPCGPVGHMQLEKGLNVAGMSFAVVVAPRLFSGATHGFKFLPDRFRERTQLRLHAQALPDARQGFPDGHG